MDASIIIQIALGGILIGGLYALVASGLTPMEVRTFVNHIRELRDEYGITIIWVEQNIHRALDFVEHAYVIENGRTVLDGAKETLLNDRGFSNKFLGLE